MNMKLFAAFHKPFYQPPVNFIVPIWAGRNGRDISGQMKGDDTGDHISQLNPYFCELTMMYWVWKNAGMQPNDVWGTSHYRRYFAAPFTGLFDRNKKILHKKPTEGNINSYVNESLKTAALQHLQHADVIIPHLVNASLQRKVLITIEEQYVRDHPAEDWQILKQVILEKYPSYESSLNIFCNRIQLAIANMMITTGAVWNDYLTWLFDILFEVHKRLPVKTDVYQQRAPGFMAERLMNLYILHNGLSVQHLPIVVFDKK